MCVDHKSAIFCVFFFFLRRMCHYQYFFFLMDDIHLQVIVRLS
ncbi:hypothetical protein LINPERPRIM_LOCUS21703 [Linum perenne]